MFTRPVRSDALAVNRVRPLVDGDALLVGHVTRRGNSTGPRAGPPCSWSGLVDGWSVATRAPSSPTRQATGAERHSATSVHHA
jgi:hypothetical protein